MQTTSFQKGHQCHLQADRENKEEQWCSAYWKGSSKSKSGAKLRQKKIQVWSDLCSFWILFSPFPHVPWPTPSPSLFWSEPFRQMNTCLFSWALLFLYEGWRNRGRNRRQFEQVAKQNRETDMATNSGTSVMHWLSVFHMWKQVSLTSDICISVKASRDAELHYAARLKKVYSRIWGSSAPAESQNTLIKWVT